MNEKSILVKIRNRLNDVKYSTNQKEDEIPLDTV